MYITAKENMCLKLYSDCRYNLIASIRYNLISGIRSDPIERMTPQLNQITVIFLYSTQKYTLTIGLF